MHKPGHFQYTIQFEGKSFSCPWTQKRFTSYYMHFSPLKILCQSFLVSAILHHISLLRLIPKSYFKINTFQPNFLCSSYFNLLRLILLWYYSSRVTHYCTYPKLFSKPTSILGSLTSMFSSNTWSSNSPQCNYMYRDARLSISANSSTVINSRTKPPKCLCCIKCLLFISVNH